MRGSNRDGGRPDGQPSGDQDPKTIATFRLSSLALWTMLWREPRLVEGWKDSLRCPDRSATSPTPSCLGRIRSRAPLWDTGLAERRVDCRKDTAGSGVGSRDAPPPPVAASVPPFPTDPADPGSHGLSRLKGSKGEEGAYRVHGHAVYFIVDGKFLELPIVQLHDLVVLAGNRLCHACVVWVVRPLWLALVRRG